MKYTLVAGDDDFLMLPAETILFLRIESIQPVERQRQNGSTFTQLKWTFSIQGVQLMGDGSDVSEYKAVVGTKIHGTTSANFTTNERNQFRRWIEAVLDMGQLKEGFEVDTDLLIGRKCRGMTKVWTGTKIDQFTGKPKTGYEIDTLLRTGNAAAPAAPAPAPAAAPRPAESDWQTVPF